MQDNATPHVTQVVQSFFADQFSVIAKPAQFLDLNLSNDVRKTGQVRSATILFLLLKTDNFRKDVQLFKKN